MKARLSGSIGNTDEPSVSASREALPGEMERLSGHAVVDPASIDPARSAITPISRFSVAYHAGPPDLTFYGRLWYRGQPQEITAEDWTAMQQRGDFAPFDFRTE